MWRIARKGDGSGILEDINCSYTGKTLGTGASGSTFEAKLTGTIGTVAIKRIDYEDYGKTKEVEYLSKLKHCNIVNMMYSFLGDHTSRDVEYMVMECMPATLWCLYFKELRILDFDIKLYMYQLLRSLAYIHAKGLCHRDIKPGNILIDPETCVLKLCDFGLAEDLSLSRYNSPQVCTIMYRGPELLLGYTNYTNSIDVWSAGCVFVELLKGGAFLFHEPDGEYEPIEQLEAITDLLGTLPTEFNNKAARKLEGLPKKEAIVWSKIVSPARISDDAASLCSGMLCYIPNSRILPHKALAHKFFAELRLPENKFRDDGKPLPPLFNFQPGEFPGSFDHLIPSYTSETADKAPESKIDRIGTSSCTLI